jgi:hypothetical protein
MRSRGAKPPQGAWRAVGWDDGAVTADGEHGRTREMLAGSVRFVPRPVTKAGAGALFLIIWHAPRRFPDLARFTASAGFALLHDPATGWTGSQFGLIESGAPWHFRFAGTASSISAGEAEPPSLAMPLADAAKGPPRGTRKGL